MSIRSTRLPDPSVRLPSDLPAIDDVRSERAPEGRPEELRVGALAPSPDRGRPRPDTDAARLAYALALPPPPAAPAGALALLRATVERIAASPAADLEALRSVDPTLAAALDPMLAAERALATRLTRLVALRETVEATRRVAVGEPR